MASDTRHAAWHNQPRYAVRLLSGPEPAGDLADGLTEFLEAVEFAWEWLDRVDPARDPATRLVILETRDGATREVWTYAPGARKARRGRQEEHQSLVEVFGFNPVAWEPGVKGFSAEKPRPRLRERLREAAPPSTSTSGIAPPPSPAVRAEPKPLPVAADAAEATVPEPAVADAAGLSSGVASVSRRIQVTTRDVWHDRLSRSCLLVSIASLWLSLVLTDLNFLLPLLATLPALYLRQRSRAAGPDGQVEEWLF